MPNSQGALPYQMIRDMMSAGYIVDGSEANLQPSSIDLQVTEEVYRMRGSYLPRPEEQIEDLIKKGSLYRASLDYPLDRGGIYLIRLREQLALPKTIHASVSNKSSAGRIDLRTRLLADGVARYDTVPTGYKGPLWLEIAPKSFPVRLHAGDAVNQMRFFSGNGKLNALEHQFAYDKYKLLRDAEGRPLPSIPERVGGGLTMTIDLCGNGPGTIIGWRSLPGSSKVLDTNAFDHDPLDFFEPIFATHKNEITLSPGVFYILNTKERIVVPPQFAMEMVNYDPSMGEFRSHFAGFFDPGWGWREPAEEQGTVAVLEVEAYGHECVIRDEQPICLMRYERMLAPPEKLYGRDLGSNYHSQSGPRLAKWFKINEATKRKSSSEPDFLPRIERPWQSWDDEAS